jgi:hypothetical protein
MDKELTSAAATDNIGSIAGTVTRKGDPALHIKETKITLRAMKTRLLCTALVGLTLFGVAPASAALRSYRATWSGASLGNTAQAVATVVIDDALLLNPGSSSSNFGAPGAAVTSFSITVFGASAGNGTWTTSDFSNYFLRIADGLILFTNWVGQPDGLTTWGDPVAFSNDFNVFNSTAGAPTGTGTFRLTTNSGTGENMFLTSFAPVSAEGARVALGDTVNLDLNTIIQTPPGLGLGQTVKVLGLPAGLKFEPATLGAIPNQITGTVLGLVGPAGVKIQILQGSKVLRTLPYNLAVDPYKFAGGFETLLLDPSQISATSTFGGIFITIPDSGLAVPYPSTTTVSASPLGSPTDVRVRMTGFSHTFPADVDVFLMAPNGRVVTLLSDAGTNIDAVNANLLFSDTATAALPDIAAITSGTYLPTNYGGNTNDTLPPGIVGAPGSSLKALLSGGISGDWKLFVSDDAAGDSGSITSWTLEFDYAEPAGKLKVSVASPTTRSPNPAYSATLERIGQPSRTGRGTFVAGATPQTVAITFPKLGALDASTYELILTEGSDLVTGTQTGATPNLVATGFRLVRPGRIPGGNPALTLSLPPFVPGDRINTPAGIGHATGTVNAQALIPLKGQLGDAQPFTTSLNLSQTNQAVVWLTPYKNKTSALGGIINIGDLGVPGRGASLQSAAAFLRWKRVADATATSYPAGFRTLNLGSIVSRWNLFTQAEALAQTLAVRFRTLLPSYIASTTTIYPDRFILRDNFALFSPLSTPPFAGKVSAKTGAFTGTLGLPAPAAKSSISGVLLQDESLIGLVGQGLVKIPITGTGLVKGSYQTSGVRLEN